MSDREQLDAYLDRLLSDHDALLEALREGRASQGAPTRLLKINAKIHAAYRSLAFLAPVDSRWRAASMRDLEELLT